MILNIFLTLLSYRSAIEKYVKFVAEWEEIDVHKSLYSFFSYIVLIRDIADKVNKSRDLKIIWDFVIVFIRMTVANTQSTK